MSLMTVRGSMECSRSLEDRDDRWAAYRTYPYPNIRMALVLREADSEGTVAK